MEYIYVKHRSSLAAAFFRNGNGNGNGVAIAWKEEKKSLRLSCFLSWSGRQGGQAEGGGLARSLLRAS